MYTLSVIVVSCALTTQIIGFQNTCLKIRVAATPHDGHANDVLLHFLAKYFDIPLSQLTIIRGQRSKRKHISLPLSIEQIEDLVAERTHK